MKTTRTLLLLSLLVATAALVVPAGAGAGTRPDPSADGTVAGGNRRLGTSERAVRGREIPGLAVDPADPNHVVEVEEEFYAGECAYHVTFDGGRTWSGGTLSAPAGFPSPPCPQFDSGGYSHSNGAVAFGRGQDVYTAFTSAKLPDGGDSILVAKSTDGGRTFETAKVVIPGGATRTESVTFRPKIEADGDRVTVVARVCDALAVPGFFGACYFLRTASSIDGGATWRAPVRLDSPLDTTTQQSNHFSQPAFTPDGKIHVVYTRPTAAPRANLRLATSSDNGATWAYSEIGFIRGVVEPKLKADPLDGTLFLAYQTNRFATTETDTDIGFQRRPAGSLSWTEPVRVNNDPLNNGVVQRLPDMARAAQGRLDLLWHDRRHPYSFPGVPARMEDYYLASSVDGGATWSANRRVTDRSVNLDVGLDRRVTGGFYWPAVAAIGENRVMAAWGDSREGDFHDDTSDVYTAIVDLGATRPAQVPIDPGPAPAVALSRLAHPGGLEVVAPANAPPAPVSRVVVVNEADPASAIAAAALARMGFGPLIPAGREGLSEEIRAEVGRMEVRVTAGPDQGIGAFLVGSESALPSKVIDDLAAAGVPRNKIVRIGGADAAATAKLVADRLDRRSTDAKAADMAQGRPAFAAAILVNPDAPGAGSATALSAMLRLPILYTGRDRLPPPTAEAIRTFALNKTLVVGGTAAVSDAVVASLPGATRLGGDDLASVSEAVVRESAARGLPVNQTFVGDVQRPVEAAVLAATAARLGGLFIVNEGASAGEAEAVLERAEVLPQVQRVRALSAAGATSGGSTVRAGASAPAPAAAPARRGQLPATGGSGGSGALALMALAVAVLSVRRRLAA